MDNVLRAERPNQSLQRTWLSRFDLLPVFVVSRFGDCWVCRVSRHAAELRIVGQPNYLSSYIILQGDKVQTSDTQTVLTLDGFPKNKEKFVRLIEFFKEILDICNDLNITPVLDGSLAVFAYTGYQEMNVNDVDLSCSEADFLRIIKALKKKGINYKLREWHVLQVLQDDLKIELGSAEYWLKNLPIDYETLQVGGYKIKMLGLNSLREFYKRGMDDKATKENERMKYEALKEKYELLNSVTQKIN